jgi:replicative DNA helicase
MAELYDTVSESIVLAGLVNNPKSLYELDGRFLKPSDFFHTENSKIYNLLKHIIVEIQPERIDEYICLTTAKELDMKLSKAEHDGLEVALQRQVPEEALMAAAKTVKKASVRRFLQTVLEEEANKIEAAEGSVSEIIGNVESRLYDAFNNLGTTEDHMVNLADKAFDFVKSLVGAESIGLDLGFTSWQKDFGKIRNGSVNGIFARMKQGKSQLALQLVIRSAVFGGIPTLLLDTELTEEMQMIRLCAQLAKVPYDYIEEGTWVKNADMVKRMAEAEKVIQGAPIIYADISGRPVEEAVSYIRKFALKYNRNPDKTPKTLVVYDYIKLPNLSALNAANEYQILGAITSKLHDEAVRLKLPIFVVGQQNRSGAEEDSITTIADSDKIARDIDSISIIRRKTERELNLDPSENGTHVLKVLASRNGPGHIGDEYVNLHFDMACGFMTEGERFTYDKLQFLRQQTEQSAEI